MNRPRPDNLSSQENEAPGILFSGTIIPPPVNDRYRQDNADAGAGLMSSWKVGKNAKMKAMIGAGWLNLSQGRHMHKTKRTSVIQNTGKQ